MGADPAGAGQYSKVLLIIGRFGPERTSGVEQLAPKDESNGRPADGGLNNSAGAGSSWTASERAFHRLPGHFGI